MKTKPKKNTCLRCGADRKEEHRLQLGGGCSAWGKYYNRHRWGVWRGKTHKINL